MKTKLFICFAVMVMAAVVLITAGCSDKPESEQATHTHDDGTVHSLESEAAPVQQVDAEAEAMKVLAGLEQGAGTHVHEDGTVHADDAHAGEGQAKQATPPGSHVHEDGTVHADDDLADDQIETDEQGRAFHTHGDGSIHFLEASESRVSGNVVQMPAEELVKYGIGVETAGPGLLEIKTMLPGEIAINTDNMAHIVPRVPGIVREVIAKLGDVVQKGDVMAIIDSRELADAKAGYLAALERLDLAQAIFDQEEKLWQEKVSSGQEYLNVRRNLAEAKINLRTSKQKLIAMGFTSIYLEALPREADELFTRFEVAAPFNGTVIEKHAARGEVLKDDAEMFIIADLSTVWVNLQVYQKDLPLISVGQHVCLLDHPCLPETHGVIDYVGPLVGALTRTATARVVLPNPSGELRPGLFVDARVTVKTLDAAVLVHNDHVQYLNDVPCIFVQVAEGFEIRGVTLGDSDGEYVAINNGLAAGERYATTNSFLLKSEMDKSSADVHVHGDGTVHSIK
jgi:cobalt-zinc-cadmium efflux system membrane fusion protein